MRLRAFADLGQDLRHVARSLKLAPGFHVTLVLTLALGIALTTVLVSVVDAVLLRPLPFTNADRLITMGVAEKDFTLPGVSLNAARMWREQTALFEHVALFNESQVEYTRGREPATIKATETGPGLFTMLGVPAERGRTLIDDDVAAGASPVAVISDDFWRRELGADPDVVGRSITLDGVARTIVGVMPAGFTWHIMAPRVWIPLDEARSGHGNGLIRVLALRRGTMEATQAQADVLSAEYQHNQPGPMPWAVRLSAVGQWRANSDVKRALWIVLAAAGCVLLIGCANAANLVLVRNASRERELAVRSALGAARWRIARQLLVENLAIAVLGGLLGVLAADWLLAAVVPLIPNDVTFGAFYPITLDPRVLGFALVATLGTGLLVGIAPALFSSARGDRLSATVISRSVTEASSAGRLRAVALAAQLAFAVVLVSGAMLFGRSFARLASVDPGLHIDRLTILNLSLGSARYPDSTARRLFHERLADQLRLLPGVTGITRTQGAPPKAAFSFNVALEAEGLPRPAAQPFLLPFVAADTAYFTVSGTPLLAGRGFVSSDPENGVAVVSAQLAQFLWGGDSPVGRRFRIDADGPWLTVVGVAGDARMMGPDDREHTMGYYAPLGRRVRAYANVLIRSNADPATLLDGVRRAVRAVDPDQPIDELAAMSDIFADAVAKPRFFLLLMVCFGACALVLASVGIYGTASFSATRRTRELAIRMALGATHRSVKTLVVRQTVLVVAIGTILGCAAAGALSRVIRGLLFGVEALDPVSLVGAALLLTAASLVASYLPVARVVRSNPLASLRAE